MFEHDFMSKFEQFAKKASQRELMRSRREKQAEDESTDSNTNNVILPT